MKHTKSIQSRLDIKHYELLKSFAEEKGLSISMSIRLILIEFLNNNNNLGGKKS